MSNKEHNKRFGAFMQDFSRSLDFYPTHLQNCKLSGTDRLISSEAHTGPRQQLEHKCHEAASAVLAHQQYQQHQRISSISASATSMHQQQQRIRSIRAAAASGHQQHQRISSKSASAASVHQHHQTCTIQCLIG